jgi:hypothetical protein
MTLIPPPTVVNNDGRPYGVVAGIVVLGSVSSAFTLLRLWYRYTCRTFGPDDYAIIPALVGSDLLIQCSMLTDLAHVRGMDDHGPVCQHQRRRG